ncbi:FAD-binding oxidoreductase [Nocardia goodfellowii]|uniref:FAD/FMN-containing dehydrogenase n=1 Tax=Nocardia goodfellowii TaxID=882446 RepID=A0ABS4Q815_9NOCA|nr:FAD-binding oxidoreductase [Nocardia goodfellowii]MBP2187280.1 FAD/FMN-containing dehydrogenase [Nocardia goodfellowii]
MSVGAAAAVSSGFAARTAAEPVVRQGPSLDWSRLSTRSRGPVLLPSDSEYATAKQLFDPRFDAARPAAVVRATDTEDVRAAVAFADEHDLSIAVRGGGHSYVGASAADGALVIDLRQMREITYDNGVAVIGAGASLYGIQAELARHGQTLPLGTCPAVGIAGLTLGGGIGVESRLYGLTCDRLREATLVLADGSRTAVSAANRPELFWALRGGGGGLGVLTSLTFRTCPATSKDIVRLAFSGTAAQQVLTGWARWLPETGRTVWASVEVSADGAGAVGCAIRLVCTAGTGVTTAARLAGVIGAAPVGTHHRTLGHLDAVLSLAGGRPDTPRTSTVAGSDVVARYSPELADAVVEAISSRSSAGGRGMVLVDPLDGAVRDLLADATACPWRNHSAVLQWIATDYRDPGEAAAWIDRAHQLVGAHSAGGYINYLEPAQPTNRYFAANTSRLSDIRAAVDPDGRMSVR